MALTAPEMVRFAFCIKNRLEQLAGLNAELEAAVATLGLTPEARYCVLLVVDEMVTNVIKYAWDDDAEHDIAVEIALVGDDVTVLIEDDGRPYNPLLADVPDTSGAIEDRPVGGLGIHLLREMMEEHTWERRDGRNRICFVKKLART